MATITTDLICNLNQPVNVTYLHGNLFSQDNAGNTINVFVMDNGEPAAIGGTVSANVIRADGATVAVTGSLSGNQCSVVLPQACYAVPGVLTIIIKLTSGETVTTVGAVVANVYRSSTDTAVDPGEIIPDISALIAAIDAAVASIPADYSELVEGVNVATGLKALSLTFNPGFIRPNTLEVVTTATGTHLISNVVHVPAMSLLYVPKISKSGSTTLLCECTSEGTPIFATLRGSITSQSDGTYVIVPVINESYFIFAGNTSMTEYMRYYVQKFTEDVVFDGNNFPCSNPAAIEYGSGPITSSGTASGEMYEHTNNILLMKGMTIEFWDTGSGSNVALSKYDNYASTILSTIVMSDGEINHRQYTATETMYVRLSARIYAPSDGNSTVCPPAKFYDWKIYYKPLHDKVYEKSPLYQKKLTVMGDSLIYGNELGNGCTWVTNIGIKYGMTYTNLGINGNTVAQQSTETTYNAMVNRTDTVPTDTDIFVLLGGANDKRLNVPIGEIGSTDKTTFIGAVTTIISNVRARCPKARILLLTTYNRYASRNTLGFGDEDYATAMIAAGKYNLVPVFDNFHCSGVNFLDPVMDGWIDECWNRQQLVDGEVVYYDPTHHFGVEGYEWITPLYEAYLSAGTATPIVTTADAVTKEYIDELLDNHTAVNITGSNQYVTPHGKYAIVNGVVYFKIMFENLSNVNSGTGTVAVANLPVPVGEPVFYEVGGSPFAIGSRFTYETVWRLYGKRTQGDYTLVYGSYIPA